MIDITIKINNSKLLINVNYVVYVDLVEDEVLYIYMYDRPCLELTNELLHDITIHDIYNRIKMVMARAK
jgi:hypothetical protein